MKDTIAYKEAQKIVTDCKFTNQKKLFSKLVNSKEEIQGLVDHKTPLTMERSKALQ